MLPKPKKDSKQKRKKYSENLNLCHNGRWLLLLLRHAHRASTVDAVPGWLAAAAFMVYEMRFLVAAPSELSPWFFSSLFLPDRNM
jgi:hypothetical protein